MSRDTSPRSIGAGYEYDYGALETIDADDMQALQFGAVGVGGQQDDQPFVPPRISTGVGAGTSGISNDDLTAALNVVGAATDPLMSSVGGNETGSRAAASPAARRSRSRTRRPRSRSRRGRQTSRGASRRARAPHPDNASDAEGDEEQEGMNRRLHMLLQDQAQVAQGRRIAGITTTNTITTTYKDGGRPTVTRNSTSTRN